MNMPNRHVVAGLLLVWPAAASRIASCGERQRPMGPARWSTPRSLVAGELYLNRANFITPDGQSPSLSEARITFEQVPACRTCTHLR